MYKTGVYVSKGRVKFFGKFDSAEKAAKEYDKHALRLMGQDALLNFPELRCAVLSISSFRIYSRSVLSESWVCQLLLDAFIYRAAKA